MTLRAAPAWAQALIAAEWEQMVEEEAEAEHTGPGLPAVPVPPNMGRRLRFFIPAADSIRYQTSDTKTTKRR
jgi:hypothetical protein